MGPRAGEGAHHFRVAKSVRSNPFIWSSLVRAANSRPVYLEKDRCGRLEVSEARPGTYNRCRNELPVLGSTQDGRGIYLRVKDLRRLTH